MSIEDCLRTLGLKPPFRHDPIHTGAVIDANGSEVFVVDHNSELPDADARLIAMVLVEAINAGARALV